MGGSADPPPDEFLDFARAAFEHRECRGITEQRAERIAAARGVERFDVTVAPQHPPGTHSVTCPHGVRYWLVPVEAGG
jgi:hypothetical protein